MNLARKLHDGGTFNTLEAGASGSLQEGVGAIKASGGRRWGLRHLLPEWLHEQNNERE